MASPDIDGGNPQSIPFIQDGATVRFILPALQYWDMVVAEYSPSGIHTENPLTPEDFMCEAGYPNPFNSRVQVRFRLGTKAFTTIGIYNVIGQCVKTIIDQEFPAGSHVVFWTPEEITPSGVYQVILQRADGALLRQKINYIK